MANSTAREQILHKITVALRTPTTLPFDSEVEKRPVFGRIESDLDILFAENFTQLQGNFSFCEDEAELVQQLRGLGERKGWHKWFCSESALQSLFATQGWVHNWHPELADCSVAITSCEALVARTGSLVLSSLASGGRGPSVYAPAHVCVAYRNQLVFDLSDTFNKLQNSYNNINWPSVLSFASGPSRTADIEKTLVTGVHGPKEVYCFLIDQ